MPTVCLKLKVFKIKPSDEDVLITILFIDHTQIQQPGHTFIKNIHISWETFLVGHNQPKIEFVSNAQMHVYMYMMYPCDIH